MQIQDLIKQIRLLIARGDFNKAREEIFGKSELVKSPEAQALGAKILTYTDGFEKAQSMFFDLEAVWSDSFEVFKIHLQLLQEQGAYNEAIGLGKTIIEKFGGNISAYALQSDNYELAGMPQEALRVCQKAIKLFGGSAEIKERIERLTSITNADCAIQESLENIKNELSVKALCANSENCSLMLRLFKSRTGVHAQAQKMGKSFGYIPVHKNLTIEDMRAHLKGEKTLGIYVSDINNTSYLMALDLDIKKPYMKDYTNSPDERARLNELLKKSCRNMLETCKSVRLPALLEASGSKGYHFWFFASEAIACKYWRMLGTWLVSKQKLCPEELSWEIFPKQDMLSSSQIGNLIKVPLGIHQKTLRRSLFINPDGFEPYPEQFEILRNLSFISKKDFESILGAITIESCQTPPQPAAQKLADSNVIFTPSKTEVKEPQNFSIAIKIPLPERNTVEVEKLLSGCTPMWAIMQKAKHEHYLEQNEIEAFVFVFSQLGEEGKVFIHQVMNQLENYQPDAVNAIIRRVPPTAIGCAKLRKKIPEICSAHDCSCQFRLPVGCYASPVIYAGIFAQASPSAEAIAQLRQPAQLSERELIGGESGGIDKLMQEYTKVSSQIAALTERAALLKRQIDQIFVNANSDTIKTRIRVYHRSSVD